MFRSYPTPPPIFWNTLLCPFIVKNLERRKGGIGGREGVRGRARRYMTCVKEGGSKGQGQLEQDGVEEGGLKKSSSGKPMQETEAPEHNKKRNYLV